MLFLEGGFLLRKLKKVDICDKFRYRIESDKHIENLVLNLNYTWKWIRGKLYGEKRFIF